MIHTDTKKMYTDVYYEGRVIRFWGFNHHARAAEFVSKLDRETVFIPELEPSKEKDVWPDLKFGPVNLWNAWPSKHVIAESNLKAEREGFLSWEEEL